MGAEWGIKEALPAIIFCKRKVIDVEAIVEGNTFLAFSFLCNIKATDDEPLSSGMGFCSTIF
jgi:hypothetical protein